MHPQRTSMERLGRVHVLLRVILILQKGVCIQSLYTNNQSFLRNVYEGGHMKFEVTVPDETMDLLMARLSVNYGLDGTYSDVLQHLIVNSLDCQDERIKYKEIEVTEL